MTPPITGHCLCGAIRYRADAAPLWQAHCHCESCRRATASGFTSFFGIADGHWEWIGQTPRRFVSSPGVERFFCPTCGSQMAYCAEGFPGEMQFYAATLDEPQAYEPEVHVHWSEHVPWIILADGLPRK